MPALFTARDAQHSVRAVDAHRLIAALAHGGISLELKTIDVCFLAALHLRADHSALAAFDEDALLDLFEQVCDVVEPGAENPRKRATHAIQRLRDQRMLVRVDGADIVRAGEYTLTRLAVALVSFYLADETLTRESLTLLTRTLLSQLAEVAAAARRATAFEEWRLTVIGPLRVTVTDLVDGIERRQRGLDAQQEEVRTEIAGLLQADWGGAIDRCQTLLDTTARTLTELNEVLLRDAHQLLNVLQDIQSAASRAEALEAEAAVGRVISQVDRIGAWGRARQRAWSEFFQYVHRYLRDVVRLDPDRALSQRLRDLLAGYGDAPFGLVVAAAPSIRLLRPAAVAVDRPPVLRPRGSREEAPEAVAPDDEQAWLAARVQAALAEGDGALAAVTARILEQVPEARRYLLAGRIAALVARDGRLHSPRERAWRAVGGGLLIEDWTLGDGESPP